MLGRVFEDDDGDASPYRNHESMPKKYCSPVCLTTLFGSHGYLNDNLRGQPIIKVCITMHTSDLKLKSATTGQTTAAKDDPLNMHHAAAWLLCSAAAMCLKGTNAGLH